MVSFDEAVPRLTAFDDRKTPSLCYCAQILDLWRVLLRCQDRQLPQHNPKTVLTTNVSTVIRASGTLYHHCEAKIREDQSRNNANPGLLNPVTANRERSEPGQFVFTLSAASRLVT